MQRKSKTFVRGFTPKFVKRKRRSSRRRSGAAAEVEYLEHGVPPEGFSVQGLEPEEYPPPQYTDEEGIEYDDGEEVEGTGHHRHHLLHRSESGQWRKRPHWKLTTWEDVRVGDVVKIMDGESIPADVLICASSEDENVAFVETKNLDGETNLKSRSAVPVLTHLRSAQASAARKSAFHVECGPPDTNLYRVEAAVVTPDEQKSPVDISMMLLRGTVLRNTDWVIGIVLFTGQDTKIVMNSGNTPSKRSRVERQMNPQVFINLILLAMAAVACGVVDAILEQRNYPRGAPWLFGATLNDDNPKINGLVTWAFALITFQNIVPISLYISIEAVRTVQALWIYFDKEIYYEKTDQATLARSWNLSDDLGQIEYIFSDKTGTLTQNAMVFRQCSIGGKVYKGDPEPEGVEEFVTKIEVIDDMSSVDMPAKGYPVPEDNASGSQHKLSGSNSPGTDSDSTDPKKAMAVKLSDGVLHHFRDSDLTTDLKAAAESPPRSPQDPRILNGFWTVLALCHTVLTSVDPETKAIEYKAQSPDEAALVQAAADVKFVFRGREREILTLTTPFSEKPERYELLNVLEFNSTRKRMSVIVRKQDEEPSRILLLTKGADNVIFERLGRGNEELKEITEKQLGEFASDGLRTLTLAYRVIPDAEYEEWSERYREATVSLDDREKRVEELSQELEHDLRLLGATAIEDRLQDGVPETIADLKEAGIKIWVATGDKLETAIAIGHSTNLIGRDDNIIIVRGGGARDVYSQMWGAVKQFFPDSTILSDQNMQENAPTASRPSDSFSLHRVNTGVTDIVGHDNGQRPGGFVLVIDGSALADAFSDELHKDLLLRLAMHCEGVICCRVSPIQKALIVKLVKDGLGAMTLAIGDGANDVSMIQAADVGVGISGEEGLQAVNSSDYAIAQFRFLKRLLLVHGHWSYYRNGNMIVNFFYKNIVCVGALFWFMIYCAWSSQYLFEYTYLLFWNSFWTILPVIAMGLFDRIVDDHVLMDLPELYAHPRRGEYFSLKLFVIYMIDGVYQSAIIFFLLVYTYWTTTSRTDGYAVYQYEFATTIAIAAVMVVTLFNGLNIAAWTVWVFWALGIEIVLIWAYTAIYSVISPGWFTTPIFGNDHYLFTSAYFWLGMLLVIPLSLLPRYAAKAYKFIFTPSDIDTVRYIHKLHPERDFARDRQRGGVAHLRRTPSARSQHLRRKGVAARTDMSTGIRSVHHGFDFAMEEGGPALRRLQSNLSERSAPAHRRKRNASSFIPSFSLPQSIRRKKPPTSPPIHPHDDPPSSH
ncbi:unnamed protein product [Somion occarium]|uniref:Phospholipid-transporting ATPase n=1 Tax=Somion occarium TaxID=3059160 RepID=A0ABP1DGD9_9APHY